MVISGQKVSLTWKSRLKSHPMFILFISLVIKLNSINKLSKKAIPHTFVFILDTEIKKNYC